MPSNVIDANNQKHTIEPYHFKILRQQNTTLNKTEEELNINVQEGEEILQNAIEQTPLPSPPAQSESEPQVELESKPNFIEELLKRTDELSDNIIKLQMKIESQESEFKERLANETAKAKEEGKKEGLEQANAEFSAKLTEIETRYLNSMKKLDEESQNLVQFLTKTEEQLSTTAIDIAKEVILKEISTNSKEVALNIAKNLISELKEVNYLEIKVNPEDLDFLDQNLGANPNIKISADEAIAKGGALVLSNVSNIDGTIQTRFEKIKKILSE